jgi:hypothetical protein
MLRDTHAADLIRREVLARQRRAVVIYGGWHLQRKNRDSNYEPSDWAPLVTLLNTPAMGRLFTVWTNTMADLEALQSDIAAWRKPSLAILRGTVLGAADFSFYFPFDGARFIVQSGTPKRIPRSQWRTLRMEDQFDAVIYLGRRSSITQARLSSALCSDPNYLQMRLRRMALMPGAPGEIGRLKRYCASHSR